MNAHEITTKVKLAAAFPVEFRAQASLAATDAAKRLHQLQVGERFCVKMGRETVWIPTRLYFASDQPKLAENSDAWRFARALQTRSNDGFERQRATQDLLVKLEPWAAPFIVALIGDYVVEILDEIDSGITLGAEQTLAAFISENPDFWNIVMQRVASYWDVYYRARRLGDHSGRVEQRCEYVGFRLTKRLGSAALQHMSASGG